jgi:hypothetical protein
MKSAENAKGLGMSKRITYHHMQDAALWRKEQDGHNPSLIVAVKGMDNYHPAFDNLGKGFVTVGDIDLVQAPSSLDGKVNHLATPRPDSPFKRCKPNKPVTVEIRARKIVKPL